MESINHKFTLIPNFAYKHFKKHHKKYVFGLLSTAVLYKFISLAITGLLANPAIHFSFADDTGDFPSETEMMEEFYSDEGENTEVGMEGDIEDGENFESEEEGSIADGSGETDYPAMVFCEIGDVEIKNPFSGDILKGEIEIEIEYKKDVCLDETLIVKLWDANTQYVSIGEMHDGATGIIFDSSLLYSGFYNITGLNVEGEEIVVYTGEYEGINTKYFTGHKLVLYSSDMSVLYEGDAFTIDNEFPTISNVRLISSGANNGFIGLDDGITVKFSSSEELTGVLVNVLGVDAELVLATGHQYEFSLILSDENTEGFIVYNIEFSDLAGNTGYYEGSSSIVFDKSLPEVVEINFGLSGENLELQIDTSNITKITFVYSLSGSDQTKVYISSYQNPHIHILSGILEEEYYNYTLSVSNQVGKIIYLGGYFQWIDDEVVFTYEPIGADSMLVVASFTGETNTGSLIDALLAEIERFNTCKLGIGDFTNIKIPVGLYNANIKMPSLEKYSVKKLVSAFSVVLFERMEIAKLSKDLIDKITDDFNDFLVILKLVQDDDNQCVQNLSNYYMSKFRNNLIKYNLTVD